MVILNVRGLGLKDKQYKKRSVHSRTRSKGVLAQIRHTGLKTEANKA